MRTLLILILFLTACGGSLSDEQRKKLRENMESAKIRRVSDAELTEASFAYGRKVAAILERDDAMMANQLLIDSLQTAYHVRILELQPGDSMLQKVESQIIEAYLAGAGQVNLSDDVQKLGADSMLYSTPVILERADGSVEFKFALGIHMPKKEIILSIKY